MKKMGFMAGVMMAGAMGLTAYVLMNKETCKKANQVINDMLDQTDKMIKNKKQNIIRQINYVFFVIFSLVIIMRKFLIFNINDEMTILSKKNPYNIYRSLEQIYKMKKTDANVGMNIYEQIIAPININKMNDELLQKYIVDFYKLLQLPNC